MVALVSLFVIVVASLIVVRIATAILVLTGLSPEVARFQARSALTGVGFTTSEAESVVGHPVRRKVVMALMLVGSAGVITAVATLMLSFVGAGGRQTAVRGVLLVAGMVGLLLVARSRLVDRLLSHAIEKALRRWTSLDVRDEQLADGVVVAPDAWVADRTLDALALRDEGIRVLGISRPGAAFLGAPVGEVVVRPGDTLIAYGRRETLERLARRRRGDEGDAEHRRIARERHEELAAAQRDVA